MHVVLKWRIIYYSSWNYNHFVAEVTYISVVLNPFITHLVQLSVHFFFCQDRLFIYTVCLCCWSHQDYNAPKTIDDVGLDGIPLFIIKGSGIFILFLTYTCSLNIPTKISHSCGNRLLLSQYYGIMVNNYRPGSIFNAFSNFLNVLLMTIYIFLTDLISSECSNLASSVPPDH
jgi:hypothetical protein